MSLPQEQHCSVKRDAIFLVVSLCTLSRPTQHSEGSLLLSPTAPAPGALVTLWHLLPCILLTLVTVVTAVFCRCLLKLVMSGSSWRAVAAASDGAVSICKEK